MLIHPWDAAISDTEWRNWLAGHDFGQLAVCDPGNGAPHVIPGEQQPVHARCSRPCQRSASDIDLAAPGQPAIRRSLIIA